MSDALARSRSAHSLAYGTSICVMSSNFMFNVHFSLTLANFSQALVFPKCPYRVLCRKYAQFICKYPFQPVKRWFTIHAVRSNVTILFTIFIFFFTAVQNNFFIFLWVYSSHNLTNEKWSASSFLFDFSIAMVAKPERRRGGKGEEGRGTPGIRRQREKGHLEHHSTSTTKTNGIRLCISSMTFRRKSNFDE